MESGIQHRFHWADYLVFVLILGLSMSTGIYFGIIKRGRQTTEDFLMAGRKMNIFPVAVSIFVR